MQQLIFSVVFWTVSPCSRISPFSCSFLFCYFCVPSHRNSLSIFGLCH